MIPLPLRIGVLVLAATAFSAIIVLLANLAADLLHALADPRIRDVHGG